MIKDILFQEGIFDQKSEESELENHVLEGGNAF